MIIARPTATEERWLLLADRYPALRTAVQQLGRTGRWKTSTWLARLGGVLLALLGVSLLAGVLSPFHSPWLVGGVLLLVVAEWLVKQRRVYRSGVEEVVYLCGGLGIVVQLLIWSHGHNDAAGTAIIATTVLLVGWRLLNPVLTTLAFAAYSLAIAFIDGNLLGGTLNMRGAAGFCAALALLAFVAGARQWRRPSHDFMCDGLIIVMPWLCCAWLMAYGWESRARDYAALAAASAFCTLWLVIGVQRRSHALLVGAMGSAATAAYSLHQLLHWPVYWQLIVAGGVLLLVAIAIERLLRGRTDGITSSAIDDMAGLDLLQLAAAAHLTPAPGHAPTEAMQGHGGEFGGGGVSGRF